MKPAGPTKSRRLTSPPAGAPAPREIVLYVEDDPDNREVATYRLARLYDVRCAATDREACALVAELGAQVSLILMDIELRGSELDGLQLTRVIRGRVPREQLPPFARAVPVLGVPIIFVTAHGDRYRRPELLAAGGNELILKPVDFVELHAAMTRSYLAERAPR